MLRVVLLVTNEDLCVLTEVTSRVERVQQLADDVREQAESRRDALCTMMDLASKISASQASLLSSLKDAKHVFGQLDPVDDDSRGLDGRQDALQVSLVLIVTSLLCIGSTVDYPQHFDTVSWVTGMA